MVGDIDMLNLDANGQYYVKFWKEVLGHLLGWSDGEVEQWAAKWSGIFEPESMFYHEEPAYYAAAVLNSCA
jgi:hypothetical protein